MIKNLYYFAVSCRQDFSALLVPQTEQEARRLSYKARRNLLLLSPELMSLLRDLPLPPVPVTILKHIFQRTRQIEGMSLPSWNLTAFKGLMQRGKNKNAAVRGVWLFFCMFFNVGIHMQAFMCVFVCSFQGHKKCPKLLSSYEHHFRG